MFLPELCLGAGGLTVVAVCSSEIASAADSVHKWGDVPVASCVLAKLLLS